MPIFALGIISTIFSGCVTENEVVNEKERTESVTEIETESDVWSQGTALHLYQEGVILSDFSLGEVEKDNEWYPTIYTDDIVITGYSGGTGVIQDRISIIDCKKYEEIIIDYSPDCLGQEISMIEVEKKLEADNGVIHYVFREEEYELLIEDYSETFSEGTELEGYVASDSIDQREILEDGTIQVSTKFAVKEKNSFTEYFYGEIKGILLFDDESETYKLDRNSIIVE